MRKYYLNLIQQRNGDYEVHAEGCRFQPTRDFEFLGSFFSCSSAVAEAKKRYPWKKINGCYYCSNECHTS